MADFQEVADQFKDMVESVRQNPSQIIDPDSVDFAKSIAMHSVTRTVSQKEFAKSAGEEFVIAKQLDLLSRKRVLDAKLLTDLSESVEDSVRAELELIGDLVMKNDDLLISIDSQVDSYGLAVGQVTKLNEHLVRQAELSAEIEGVQLNMRGMNAEERKFAEERLANLREEAATRGILSAKEQEISALGTLRNEQQKVFGVSVESIKDRIDETGDLMNTTAGRLTIIAGIMKVLLTPVIAHMKELRDLGLTWSQTMDASADTVSAMMDRGFVRGLLTMRSTAEVVSAMRGNFADISFQSAELVALGGELVTSFKLSGDESVQLLEALTKVGGVTESQVEDILHMAQAFGQVNNINPGALLRAASQHAGVFARFGEQGADAFFRSVTAAERLGIELSSIESTADSFLDIDTFFQDVSKLRTLGIDIADPFGLAQIAEQGTPEELLSELQRQMQGVDLTSLGRTRRNALASAIGMDVSDLSRLIQGPSGGISDVSDAQLDEFGGFAEGMGGAVDAMGEMVSSLGGISGLLQTIVGLMLAQQALGLLGGGAGGIGKLLSLGRAGVLGAGGLASGAAGSVAGGLGSAGAAAGAGALAAAPLALGALAVGGGVAAGGAGIGILLEQQKIRTSEASGAAADAERARVVAERQRQEDVIRARMPDATASELVEAFRQGVRVDAYIDGRRTGDALRRSQGSANR